MGKWRPEPKCAICQATVKAKKKHKEPGQELICDSCRQWGAIVARDSPEAETKKQDPMATDSRGLHEKYFNDG